MLYVSLYESMVILRKQEATGGKKKKFINYTFKYRERITIQ